MHIFSKIFYIEIFTLKPNKMCNVSYCVLWITIYSIFWTCFIEFNILLMHLYTYFLWNLLTIFLQKEKYFRQLICIFLNFILIPTIQIFHKWFLKLRCFKRNINFSLNIIFNFSLFSKKWEKAVWNIKNLFYWT